jgi:hypothetical protein
LSSDGRWLAVQSESNRLDLFSLDSDRPVKSFDVNGLFADRTVAFSPQSFYLFAGGSLLNLKTLETTSLISATDIAPACFSSDGRVLAFVENKTGEIVLWARRCLVWLTG